MGEEADLVRMTAEIASARVLEHGAQPTRQASTSTAPRPRAIHQQVNLFSRMMSPSVTIGSMVRSNRATVLPPTAASQSTAPAEQVASPDESSDDAGEQNKGELPPLAPHERVRKRIEKAQARLSAQHEQGSSQAA